MLDVSLVRGGAEAAFFVYPLIENNLPGSSGDGGDPNKIFLSSFAVDISELTGPTDATTLIDALGNDSTTSSLLHYRTPWSGSVGSGGGKGSAWVVAFPVELASRLAVSQALTASPSLWINLRVGAFGSTTTRDIESDPFDYPISICAGCLIHQVQPCPYTSPPTYTGNPCNVAQDAPVDCCAAGNDLICPPTVSGQ